MYHHWDRNLIGIWNLIAWWLTALLHYFVQIVPFDLDSFAFRFGLQTGVIWQLNNTIKVAQGYYWLRCMVASRLITLHQFAGGTGLRWLLKTNPSLLFFTTKPASHSCLESKAYSHSRLQEVFILTHYKVLTDCMCMRYKHSHFWTKTLCEKARTGSVKVPNACILKVLFHVFLTESHHLRWSHMTLSQQCGRRIGHPHSLQCSHSHSAALPASLISSVVVFWITLPLPPSALHTVYCCLH